MSFSQQNQSFQNVITTISAVTPAATNEIFRVRLGNVTQLDSGSGFGFTSDRWFSMGRVVTNTNTVYGSNCPTKRLLLVIKTLLVTTRVLNGLVQSQI